jgi:streptomycin 6-kinase
VAIPDNFTQTMREVYGTEGDAWLRRLPAILSDCARRWSLTVGLPFEPLSYNYVAPAARSDGTRTVLKVGFPCKELMGEIEALRLYDGAGIARLLAAEPEQGALLLERLEPGTSLARLADDEAETAIAAQVMLRLWRPAPAEHSFPTVSGWARGLERLRARFGGGTGPLPAAWVETAERLFEELLNPATDPMLLHGDLHHGNILAAQREPWLAIDPKGLVGDPGFEVGAFLANEILEKPEPAKLMARRVAQLSEALRIDRARLRAWGIAFMVLSAWWSVEDHGHGWEGAIVCAEMLAESSRS